MRLFSPDLVCQQAVELVTDYLEGRLSRRDRRRFEAHLRACPNCSTYLEQIRSTIAATGRMEPESLDAEAKQELVDLFRRFRNGEEPGPAGPGMS
jgi:anti-sigma factor RsiW